MLLIGSLGAMWAWWGKQFHEPKCGSGHVCRVMAWTRHQGLVPYIGSWERPKSGSWEHSNLFYLHIWSSCLERTGVPYYLFTAICAWPFQFDLQLKVIWTIYDLIKLNNEIINTINLPSNYFTVKWFQVLVFNSGNSICLDY